MQLLLEEFFKKVYWLSTGKTSVTLFLLVRFMFYSLVIGTVALVTYLAFTKRYVVIAFIAGAVLLGEIAHYFRKTREKDVVDKKVSEKESIKGVLGDRKVKNKKGLLNGKKVKNKDLLKKSKPKNKDMIKEKVKAVKV